MSAPRTRARRPVAVLVAAFVGLAALGAGTGAALGAVGGAPTGPHPVHHHDDGPGRALRMPGR